MLLLALLSPFLWQVYQGGVGDTIWLVICGKKMLDGEILYKDILETNPPMSVFLYFPAALVSHVFGVSANIAANIETGALLALMAMLSMRVISEEPSGGSEKRVFLAILAAILVLQPNRNFAQREHLAVALLLPYLLSAVRTADGRDAPAIPVQILIGLCAAIALAIKPHFLLPGAAISLAAFAYTRSWRSLVNLPNIIIAAICVVYLAATWLFFPDFFEFLPLLLSVYLPERMEAVEFFTRYPLTLVGYCSLLITLLILRMEGWQRGAVIFLVAASAFFLVYLLQGKGYMNHLYPVAALCALALLMPQAQRTGGAKNQSRQALIAGFALIAAGSLAAREPFDVPELTKAVASLENHQSMILLSSSMTSTIKLSDDVGAEWASRLHTRWMSLNAYSLARAQNLSPERRKALIDAVDTDRRILREDIAAKAPQLIIFDTGDPVNWETWALEDQGTRKLLDSYRLEGSYEQGRYRIYQRG